MIGGVNRQGGKPGLPNRVTLSTGVKFCHVNVSRWGNPLSRGRIRDTSNSRKIHFGCGFASLLKVWSGYVFVLLQQLRPQGLLAFQYGGGRREDAGTQKNHVTGTDSANLFKMAAKINIERIWVQGLETGETETKWRQRQIQCAKERS